jgi:hypothetical protein
MPTIEGFVSVQSSIDRNTNISMAFTIKEIFYTLQGEGAHTGRAA